MSPAFDKRAEELGKWMENTTTRLSMVVEILTNGSGCDRDEGSGKVIA